MQIVIDITEKDYEKIRETSFVENTETMFKQSSEDRKGTMMLFRIIDAIKNGIPLPKGHGRLIDADKIGLTNFECFMCGGDYKEGLKMLIHKIETAPTIIEAEKEEMEWISIDKNVPTNGQRVLVCFNDGFILIGAYINYADDGKEPYWVFDGEEDFNLEDAQVIAWMPLPESYKAESEVEE